MKGQNASPARDPLETFVWQAELQGFGPEAYEQAVERIVQSFEERRAEPLVPRETGVVALKVQTVSGGGLSTPQSLVRAIANSLERRGFERRNIRVVDVSAALLREAGFLPSLSDVGGNFEDMPVQSLDTEAFYDPIWFYDNAIPPPRPRVFASTTFEDERGERVLTEEERRSYLPTNLFLDVDFWINLPVVSDHRALLLQGALTNASVHAVSNARRFLSSSTTGPVAVAEIASIPELREKCAFTLLSLERFQYIGGPVFNSLYTESEPLLWLSTNATVLDSLMLDRINSARQENGFDILRSSHPLLDYAESVGLGFRDTGLIEWIYP